MKHTRYTLRRQRKIMAWFVALTAFLALGIPGLITAHFAKASTKNQNATSTPEVVIQQQVIQDKPAIVQKVSATPSGSNQLPSREQKQATAVACAHAWESHRTELEEANISNGVYMTTCYNDLLAIAKHESGFNNNAENVSSREKSYGPFQINRNAHPYVTIEQAKDYVFAVNWTINRIHSKNYPVNRTLALQYHNGWAYDDKGHVIIVYASAVKASSDQFLKMGL